MSENAPKDQSSAKKSQEKQVETHEDLNNPDANIDDANLDPNEGGDFDDGKNLEEDKNQEGDNEHGEGGQDHAEGDEAGSFESQGDQTNEVDVRSVYVKNVDYSASKEEVAEFFKSCGKINRVSIIKDKYTGAPKGYAYIEFEDKDGAENAVLFTDSTFKGRTIEVLPKRTNIPSRGRGRGRGRGGRGFMGLRRGFTMFTKPKRGRGGYRPF